MSKTTLDLSTLSDISDGTHTVKVKAKADGYYDSEFSNEVSYTKAPSVVTYYGTIKSGGSAISVSAIAGIIGEDSTILYSNYNMTNQGVSGYSKYDLALNAETRLYTVTKAVNCTYEELYSYHYYITPNANGFVFEITRK